MRQSWAFGIIIIIAASPDTLLACQIENEKKKKH